MMRWNPKLALGDAVVAWLGLPVGIFLASLLFAVLSLLEVSAILYYLLPLLLLTGYLFAIIHLRYTEVVFRKDSIKIFKQSSKPKLTIFPVAKDRYVIYPSAFNENEYDELILLGNSYQVA